jgi:transposase
MSMRAVPWPDPDPVVAAAIRVKYAGRRVPLAVAVRDRLGQWMADELFAAAFGVRGRPGWPPSRLAVVTVLQMAEDLTDRQAAEAVRTRLDWQYALGLGLADPGFDHSVLSEFRGRVAAHGLEEAALDALLARLAAEGLVRAGGKQRTDSTHVLAAVRALHTTELAGESVRAALEALAAACPDWLKARFCLPDWDRRYGTPVTTWRRQAPGKAERDKAALQYARDGYALVAACYEESAPPWLREIPAVQVLRTVLIQSFTQTISEGGQEAISRREPGDSGDGVPPAHTRISSPYDGDVRWGAKKDLTWLGYKLHISETCQDPPACGCPAGPAAAGSGRCGHDVLPNLITGVATTRASVADAEMTTPVNAALHRRDLAPGRHYLDAGYGSARHVLDAARLFGITLVTPLPADSSRQARAGDGYGRTAFAVDYDARTVTCPQGKPSTGWTTARQESRDVIVVRFGITTCRPCPARQLCTTARRNGRQLTILPRDQHELQAAVRAGQQGEDWQEDYKRRAGIEGAVSQAVTVTSCRRTRYRGLSKTHLGHVYSAVALNLCRLDAYWNNTPLNRGRTSHLTRLSLATSETELTTNINGDPKCRSDHRMKQDRRWSAEQLPGGFVRWTMPSGRQYVTEPTRYPI